jgi:hypothetical protein|tara:strand:+ start:312 stop:611 length:300 start_codon:yes stop_codon:yes gene_type:complete
MKRISLPLLRTQKDIDNSHYPHDLEPGMYVWDELLRDAILITDLSSAELHKLNIGQSRNRFASRAEIIKSEENIKFPHVTYNTITKWNAFNNARVIYNL